MEGSAGWMAYRAARSNSIRTAFLLRGTLLFFPSSANAVTGISEQKVRERGYVRGACGCVWVRDCLRVYERGWLRLEGRGREKKKTPEKKMCKRSVYEEPALKRGRRNRERELLVRTSCNHAEPHRNRTSRQPTYTVGETAKQQHASTSHTIPSIDTAAPTQLTILRPIVFVYNHIQFQVLHGGTPDLRKVMEGEIWRGT